MLRDGGQAFKAGSCEIEDHCREKLGSCSIVEESGRESEARKIAFRNSLADSLGEFRGEDLKHGWKNIAIGVDAEVWGLPHLVNLVSMVAMPRQMSIVSHGAHRRTEFSFVGGVSSSQSCRAWGGIWLQFPGALGSVASQAKGLRNRRNLAREPNRRATRARSLASAALKLCRSPRYDFFQPHNKCRVLHQQRGCKSRHPSWSAACTANFQL